MTQDAWLPVGHEIPGGMHAASVLQSGEQWQLWKTKEGGLALLAAEALGSQWLEKGLLGEPPLVRMTFGPKSLFVLVSEKSGVIFPLQQCKPPQNKGDAMAVAVALRETRAIDPSVRLHDAICVEQYSRLLPTYTLSPSEGDDIVLGTYLTGGIPVSVLSHRRMEALMSWLGSDHLHQVLTQAGFAAEAVTGESARTADVAAAVRPREAASSQEQKVFALAGRPALQSFFEDHVIDIVENQERYAALGVTFPSAIVLHGPPGSGKTFAVEKLVDYLGWPSFEVNCASIGSPYIHETGRKISDVFDRAIKNAPSVVVIDEMEAFLADRGTAGGNHHRVEEVGEFLRRIPEAIKNHVLVVAMTNRIDMIDPAILRRGRFDHVVEVDMPSAQEVEDVIRKLTSELPCEEDLRISVAAKRLAGRPMSDAAFVVREAARLSARAGKSKVDGTSFEAALDSSPPRDGSDGQGRKMGFM